MRPRLLNSKGEACNCQSRVFGNAHSNAELWQILGCTVAINSSMSLFGPQIRQLCLTAKEIFMSQPNLLELEAPIKICGELTCLKP